MKIGFNEKNITITKKTNIHFIIQYIVQKIKILATDKKQKRENKFVCNKPKKKPLHFYFAFLKF